MWFYVLFHHRFTRIWVKKNSYICNAISDVCSQDVTVKWYRLLYWIDCVSFVLCDFVWFHRWKTLFKCLERIRAFDYDFGLISNRMNRLKLFSHLAPMGQFTVFWVHFELKSSHEFDVSKGPSNKVSWRKLHTSIKPTKSTLPINKFGFSLRFEHVCSISSYIFT